MTDPTVTTKIYVASLADYNAGRLHGVWINVDGGVTDADDIQQAVAEMLRKSKHPNVRVECPECEGDAEGCEACHAIGTVPSAEEWAIHDHEGFGGMVGEYSTFEEVATHAKMIDKHGAAWTAYVSWTCESCPDEDGFEDAYNGEWDSREDFARHMADECLDIPESMASYFDYEAFARDLFMDYADIDNPEGGIFVFRSR